MSYSKTIIFLSISLLSCGYFDIIKPSKKQKPTQLEQLETRYQENLEKLQSFPSWGDDCDSTLWAGLAKAGGVKLDISASKAETGQWYRRPSKDCYSTGSSRSTFSNDMAVGIILSASIGDLKHWFTWVVKNGYVMGEGDPGAVIMKPNILGVLGRRLGMNLAPRYPYIRNNKDYVRHIQTLMIYVDSRSTGFITRKELELLKSYDNGSDYLIMAVIGKYDGSQERTVSLLLQEPKPPSYVRGDPERYRLAHWLFAASIVLGVSNE